MPTSFSRNGRFGKFCKGTFFPSIFLSASIWRLDIFLKIKFAFSSVACISLHKDSPFTTTFFVSLFHLNNYTNKYHFLHHFWIVNFT